MGDTVDDARSACAAGVPFIAVVAPAHERRRALRAAMRQEGAIAVVDDVNQIEAVLP